MKRQLIFFLLLSVQFQVFGHQPISADTIKVLAWNIYGGANEIPNGRYHAIDIIRELNPDVVLMVETYGSGKEIAESLNMNFHLVAKEGTPLDDKGVNLSILSKHPFGDRIDTPHSFYLGGREILIGEHRIRFLSNWFHYTPWHDAPETLGMNTEELLGWEKTGTKWEMFQKVLPYFKNWSQEAGRIPVIIGGDMNTPSHLDWGEETKAQHNGLVFPWQTTSLMESIGYIDSYREINPNPIAHPGITWDQKEKKDEHRIDYIYYKGSTLQAIASEIHKVDLGDTIQINGTSFTYPSDHGFVLTTFIINK